MKLHFILILSSVGVLPIYAQHNFASITEKHAYACNDVPELNKKVIDFVKESMNKTVGRGECWDLAASALNTTGALWDKNFKFGKEIDVKKDCIYPGDIIQFENVELAYTRGDRSFREKMAQHTAIVYEIKGEGDFVMADQNTNIHGRRVGLSPLNLKDIKKGKYTVYQPVKK